ncbi:MAG: hypothetical protein ABSF34_16995 [Verrucomicrobiota bacterium]
MEKLMQVNLADELGVHVSSATLIRRDEPMAKHTTLRVGGPADAYLEPATEAVRTPALGDQRKRWLHDVALLAGARQGLDTQLKNIQISDLGHATKVTIDKNSTVIENGTILHQLCSPVQPRSHPLADSSQHGNRHYSSTQPTTV